MPRYPDIENVKNIANEQAINVTRYFNFKGSRCASILKTISMMPISKPEIASRGSPHRPFKRNPISAISG